MNAQLVPDVPEADVEVAVLAWPAREPSAASSPPGRPRILVRVAHGPPPVVADELEDWVREPVDLVEVAMRTRHPSRPVTRPAASAPRLGARRHRSATAAAGSRCRRRRCRSCSCSLADLGHVVRTADLRRASTPKAAAPTTTSPSPPSCVAWRRRWRPSGSTSTALRDRGYLLDRTARDGSASTAPAPWPLLRSRRRSRSVGPAHASATERVGAARVGSDRGRRCHDR